MIPLRSETKINYRLINISRNLKAIKNIKIPFYISKNVKIDGGRGVLVNSSKLENTHHISKYI